MPVPVPVQQKLPPRGAALPSQVGAVMIFKRGIVARNDILVLTLSTSGFWPHLEIIIM